MTSREPTPAPVTAADRKLWRTAIPGVLLCADDRHVYAGDAPVGPPIATFDADRVWRGDHADGVPVADIPAGEVFPHGGFYADPVAVSDTGDPADAALLAVWHLVYEGDPSRIGRDPDDAD